jgi:hypothetical protein
MILRKLGSHTDALLCSGGHHCPGIFELTSGDFAIVGQDITSSAASHLPAGSGCGPDERVVSVPRRVLVHARADIPVGV